MTAAVKIHLRDPSNPKGVACGKNVDPTRISKDPDEVTCVVCRTFSEAGRAVVSAHHRGSGKTGTILDRMTSRSGLVNLDRADPARDAALLALATRYLDEFLELYRTELAGTNGK